MNILLLLLWLLYPIIEAVGQRLTYFKDLNKVTRPNYLQLWVIRGIFAILHGALLGAQPEPWYEWPALLCFQMGTFYLIFNPLLNKLRKLPWDYEGKNSGWLSFINGKAKIPISLALIIIYFVIEYSSLYL